MRRPNGCTNKYELRGKAIEKQHPDMLAAPWATLEGLRCLH
jgi:hypothetical protein